MVTRYNTDKLSPIPGHKHETDLEDLDDMSVSPSQNTQKRQNPPCCFLIKSRHALKLWTLFIFLVTVLTCTGVILVSIWLMLDCRNKLGRIRTLLDNGNVKYCTNLGLQVLFACCVVLLAVFGLGCIGRRMTGYAMMIISGVAFFQSAMTLVFNECQTEVKNEFLTSLSSNLRTCRLGTKNPPFELMKYYYKMPDIVNISVKTNKREFEVLRKMNKNKKYKKRDSEISFNFKTSSQLSVSERIFKKQQREKKKDDFLVRQIISDLLMVKKFELGENSGKVCDKNSAYIFVLAKFVSREEVEQCITLCHSYQDFCGKLDDGKVQDKTSSTAPLNISSDSSGKTLNNSNNSMWLHNTEQNSSTLMVGIRTNVERNSEKREELNAGFNGFDDVVSSCGSKVWGQIRQFCFYDNMIFMPLSLGGPVFYMLLSLAFMYLGYCDKMLKEPVKPIDKVKSMTSLIPASLSEPVLHGRISTQSLNGHELNSATNFPILFDSTSQTPDSRHIQTNMTSHVVPKVRVVNERSSLDFSSDRTKHGNYGINHSFLTPLSPGHQDREDMTHSYTDYNNSSTATSTTTSNTSSTSTSNFTTTNLGPPYLGIPSSSVSSRATTDSFMSDSD